jgi:hypothetical protein
MLLIVAFKSIRRIQLPAFLSFFLTMVAYGLGMMAASLFLLLSNGISQPLRTGLFIFWLLLPDP